jgi:hypothetical protein
MMGYFKGVEEASTKNGVVRVVHVHYIKSYVFSMSIAKVDKRHWQRYGAYFGSHHKPLQVFSAALSLCGYGAGLHAALFIAWLVTCLSETSRACALR